LFFVIFRYYFVKTPEFAWQEAALNSQGNEMDEILRAMSAENDRLLSASHNSQRGRPTSVSCYIVIVLQLQYTFVFVVMSP